MPPKVFTLDKRSNLRMVSFDDSGCLRLYWHPLIAAPVQVRNRSQVELEIFKNRWKKAVKEDDGWNDPYKKPLQ